MALAQQLKSLGEIIMTESNKQSAAALAASAIATARKEAPGITKRSSSYYIDPRAITRRPGFNPRVDFGEIAQLEISILANNLLNPIRVKRLAAPIDGKVFELIDGDRRLTAIENILKKNPTWAAAEGIPAIIVDKQQDDVTSLIQMFVANDGKAFLPLEEAAAYQRMRDAGMTVKQIGDAVGRKHMHVNQILALVNADESLKQAVAEGKIGKTMAKEIASTARGDKAKQKELTEAAVAVGKDKGKRRVLLKSVQATKVAKAAKKGRTLKIRALDDAALSELGASMAKALQKNLMNAKAAMHADALDKWVSQDAKLVAAFTYGALQALKAAAGAKSIKLEF
jgi:ParB/RepB/Spo0J family partition protein